jgi:hypothetical protein
LADAQAKLEEILISTRPVAGDPIAIRRKPHSIPLVGDLPIEDGAEQSFEFAPCSRSSRFPAADASAFYGRFGGSGDAGQELGESSSGGRVAAGQLGHLGEAELGIGEREASLGFFGRRKEVIELGLMLDPHPTSLEELQLAVERP